MVVFPILALLGQQGIPQGSWWDSPWDPIVLLTIVTGLATVWAGFTALTSAQHVLRREVEADLRRIARRALGPLNRKLPDVPITDLGVHVWIVADGRLKRLVKYTIEHQRARTPIQWTPGKGVIGVAWIQKQPLTANLEELYKEADQLTPEQFNALASEHRYGLSHAEVRVGQGYRSVLAYPLTDSADAVIGVLSVDCRADGQSAKLSELLADRDFQDVLGTCEAALRRYVGDDEESDA